MESSDKLTQIALYIVSGISIYAIQAAMVEWKSATKAEATELAGGEAPPWLGTWEGFMNYDRLELQRSTSPSEGKAVLTNLKGRQEGSWRFDKGGITLLLNGNERRSRLLYLSGCMDEFLTPFPPKAALLYECFIRKTAEDGPNGL